jgi:hypothetical protein
MVLKSVCIMHNILNVDSISKGYQFLIHYDNNK